MNSQGGSQSSRLYIGGLTPSVQQKDIDELFNKFGKILEIRMNRNFAFVQFSEESEAQAAIKELNGTQHFGRRLDVQVARHPKSGGGPGGGGGGPPKGGEERDGRDRSPIGRGGGGGRGEMGGGRGEMGGGRGEMGGGRGEMGGGRGDMGGGRGDMGGGRGDMGGGRGGGMGGGRGGFGGRGGDRGGMYNSGGGRGGFNDEPGFGGRGGGDFRSDFRGGGGDFPSQRDGPPPFGGGGRSSDGPGGLFGPTGGREFSLAPPTGFRDTGNMGNKFWGGGSGGGGGGLNEKAFDSRPRDVPSIMSYNQERPPTHQIEKLDVSNEERTNDIEIIIVDKSMVLTEYGEAIERRMSLLGFSVDVLYPNEAVPLARVLANIASRGTLYAIVITHVHQINGSLTLHILHGRPQEHRNMAIDDAETLLLRNYESYSRSCKQKGTPNCPPEQVRHLMTRVLNGRPLTATQYDILVQFLIQEKLKLEPQENQNATAQQAELQTRILSILNKTSTNNDPMGMQAPAPAAIQPAGPLLQDPSIQKALDNLMQGGDILRKIVPQQPTPFGRF